MSQDINQPEYIDTSEVDKNHNYWRQDEGGMVTNHNGVADRLLKNDALYNSLKGDWKRSDWNSSKNILVTTGREDGKFYIRREQMNTDAVAERCAAYRAAAEAGSLGVEHHRAAAAARDLQCRLDAIYYGRPRAL
jgi:hypothetical protein